MEPIPMIVGALAAGAATGLTDTATGTVKDAYASLRDLVRRRFAGRRAAETVLAEHEKAPQMWQSPLSAELTAAGADTDVQIIAAAQRGWPWWMRLAAPRGSIWWICAERRVCRWVTITRDQYVHRTTERARLGVSGSPDQGSTPRDADARGAQGVLVGKGNVQVNIYAEARSMVWPRRLARAR